MLEAGALPVMLPLTGEEAALAGLVSRCDGILLTGGQDVDPALYGEEKLPACGRPVPARDEMELLLTRLALAQDKPLLGICRGIQLLNVALGGSLYQDLPTQHYSQVGHEQKPPYDRPAHTVSVLRGTPLAALLGKKELAVTSRHHQAVKALAAPLEAMAYSPDGLVEAAWMPDRRFVWAFQWHPEHTYKTGEDSRKIFAAFAAACRGE